MRRVLTRSHSTAIRRRTGCPRGIRGMRRAATTGIRIRNRSERLPTSVTDDGRPTSRTSLRMYSDLGTTTSHKVGVVFNLVDEMKLLRSLDRHARERRAQPVSGGVRPSQPLATGHSAIPVKDVWFDVAIVRTGTNKVRVRIGNEEVLAYDQLPSAPQGYIRRALPVQLGSLRRCESDSGGLPRWIRYRCQCYDPAAYRAGWRAALPRRRIN